MADGQILLGDVGRLITLDPAISGSTLTTTAGCTAKLVTVNSATNSRTEIGPDRVVPTNDGKFFQFYQQANDFFPGGLTTWQLVVTTGDNDIFHSPEVELVIGSAL